MEQRQTQRVIPTQVGENTTGAGANPPLAHTVPSGRQGLPSPVQGLCTLRALFPPSGQLLDLTLLSREEAPTRHTGPQHSAPPKGPL